MSGLPQLNFQKLPLWHTNFWNRRYPKKSIIYLVGTNISVDAHWRSWPWWAISPRYGSIWHMLQEKGEGQRQRKNNWFVVNTHLHHLCWGFSLYFVFHWIQGDSKSADFRTLTILRGPRPSFAETMKQSYISNPTRLNEHLSRKCCRWSSVDLAGVLRERLLKCLMSFMVRKRQIAGF